MKRLIARLTACILITQTSTSAAVVTYYRFETDLDPDPNRLETPNEVAGGTALISENATLDTSANPGSLPNTVVPLTGEPNTASLDNRALPGGSGDPDLDARADYTPLLDLDEFTVEMWIRSEETTGVLIARSSTEDVLGGIDDGFRIFSPDALTVDFYTTGVGGSSLHTIATGIGLDDLSAPRGDGSAAWRHIAFQYSMADGLGRLFVDGSVVGSASTAPADVMFWGNPGNESDRILQVGVAMDGYNFSKTADDNGYIDEIRFTDIPLPEDELLPGGTIPEPAYLPLLTGLTVLVLTAKRRAHPRHAQA